ncbi:hypothetical protein INR49_007196 [Caranx melampygus]|nr:hypothetical protein INR49_007196 [Caranx melampygus]
MKAGDRGDETCSLHQGFKALCGAGGSHHDRPVVVGRLKGFLIFLRPDETQHGSVQELVSDAYITASSAYSVKGLKPYDVAEGSWSHEVRQFGHLEDVDRTFCLQLVSQRQEGAEGSCCDSAHTGGGKTNKKNIS